MSLLRRALVLQARAHCVLAPAARGFAVSTSASSTQVPPPRPVEESDVVKAYRRDIEHTKEYDSLNIEDPEALELARRKRLIYRAKQRGWLEVDLLLGSYAHDKVMGLNEQQLDEFEDILKLETVDVYNWVLGREPVPQEVESSVFRELVEYARTSPIGRADPEGYAKVKATMSN